MTSMLVPKTNNWSSVDSFLLKQLEMCVKAGRRILELFKMHSHKQPKNSIWPTPSATFFSKEEVL